MWIKFYGLGNDLETIVTGHLNMSFLRYDKNASSSVLPWGEKRDTPQLTGFIMISDWSCPRPVVKDIKPKNQKNV